MKLPEREQDKMVNMMFNEVEVKKIFFFLLNKETFSLNSDTHYLSYISEIENCFQIEVTHTILLIL